VTLAGGGERIIRFFELIPFAPRLSKTLGLIIIINKIIISWGDAFKRAGCAGTVYPTIRNLIGREQYFKKRIRFP
jgi:hypothetical protein